MSAGSDTHLVPTEREATVVLWQAKCCEAKAVHEAKIWTKHAFASCFIASANDPVTRDSRKELFIITRAFGPAETRALKKTSYQNDSSSECTIIYIVLKLISNI
jgi:hypothetical protein